MSARAGRPCLCLYCVPELYHILRPPTNHSLPSLSPASVLPILSLIRDAFHRPSSLLLQFLGMSLAPLPGQVRLLPLHILPCPCPLLPSPALPCSALLSQRNRDRVTCIPFRAMPLTWLHHFLRSVLVWHSEVIHIIYSSTSSTYLVVVC